MHRIPGHLTPPTGLTFTLASCGVDLLQPCLQSTEVDPRQVVGSVPLLGHDQGQLTHNTQHNRVKPLTPCIHTCFPYKCGPNSSKRQSVSPFDTRTNYATSAGTRTRTRTTFDLVDTVAPPLCPP